MGITTTRRKLRKEKASRETGDQVFVASQWQLMWMKFVKHKLAIIGSIIVISLYTIVLFHGFVAPYEKQDRFKLIHFKPQKVHLFRNGKLSWPFVYGVTSKSDPKTYTRAYVEDKSLAYPINLFVRGSKYKLFGLFDTDVHLLGVPEGGVIFVMGTDELGRDLFSRILYGGAISLSIGLMGVLASFILGAILGGISGYYGGIMDMIIQRVIEFLLSMPTIPLWMALSVAVPIDWPPTKVYFAITLILSLRGWCGLARVVRGKLLELREEDFVMAAKLAGANDVRIITRHMLPSFLSYLIVDMTLAIPGMILGETALSFLGLGLRPPVVSWGVLLQQATNVRTVASFTVLGFNFMGDGLRDAADPYKT